MKSSEQAVCMELFERVYVEAPGKPDVGDAHMAHDELLLDRAISCGSVVLRSYSWTCESVTFGYFQSLAQMETAFPGSPLTRRWTGGGAVRHGDPSEFTYALAIPRAEVVGRSRASEIYALLHGAVARALGLVGVEVRLVSPEEVAGSGEVCFQSPVVGDVVLASTGEKVAGAAQRKTREGVLIQGSIRLSETVPSTLAETLAKALGRDQAPLSQTPATEIRNLVAAKYGTTAWLEKTWSKRGDLSPRP